MRRRLGHFSVASRRVTGTRSFQNGGPLMMHTTIKDLPARLEGFLSEKVQAPVRVVAARALAGGASRDTWAIDVEVGAGPDAGRHALVLRRDLGGEIDDQALSREQEFRVLAAAHA